MQEEAALKARLAKALRSRDIENLWVFLKEDRHVEEVLDGYQSFAGFLKTARRIKRAGQSKRSSGPTVGRGGPPPGESRAWALSTLVAAVAEREEPVIKFRDEVLKGSTIARSDVAYWIENHWEKKLPMTRDLTVTVEDSDVEYDDAGWIRLKTGASRYRLVQATARVLEYAGAEGGGVLRVGVRAYGELDRLRRLSEFLARHYRWQPAQATIFVLTGVVPLIARIRTTTDMVSADPWADRVVLDIDPAESSDEVASAFTRAVRTNRPVRNRPLKEKHARLAVHAFVECADLPWKQRTARWNASHPDWACSEANYRRDALDARNRLLRTHSVGARGSKQRVTH